MGQEVPATSEHVVISGWRPGLIGAAVEAHSRYYARNWGFGGVFEAKVAREMAAFFDRYDPARDAALSVTDQAGRYLATLVIDGSDPELSPGWTHLRWFIVVDAVRGQHLGSRLMADGMRFVVASGASHCYLTTFRGLDTARRLYERHGFELVSETMASSWGRDVAEQRFEWCKG